MITPLGLRDGGLFDSAQYVDAPEPVDRLSGRGGGVVRATSRSRYVIRVVLVVRRSVAGARQQERNPRKSITV
ncbi:hypothetical protein [Streptomyces sp. 061-3]|uniref:hypothetical protein n=1 Tax=Streptomyces sp. 061-3 TaxID=2789268 RepID=UPI0039808656